MPEAEALGQGRRELLVDDLPLGLFDVVLDAAELDRPGLGVVDGEGGPGIAVARLADRAGIDEVAHALLEPDLVRVPLEERALDVAVLVGVDEGEMGVAEEADRRLDVGEGLGGVELAEDVVVLVEGRAVADGDRILDDLGALLQADQEIEVLPGDRLLGPEDGRGGDGVEGLDGIEPGDRLVVVAADDGQGLEGQDLLDDLVRRGPVADEVAEKDVVVDLSSSGWP